MNINLPKSVTLHATAASPKLPERRIALHNLSHRGFTGGLVSLLYALACLGFTSPLSADQLAEVSHSSPARAAYRFAPGDILDVKFQYVPELNESVKVRPDGMISLQRIGDIPVEGLTPAELTTRLTQRYAALIRQPDLTVIVRDFAIQQVFVGGEVMQPGTVPLRGQMTSLQAILATGGARPTGRLSNVLLIRYREGNQAGVSTIDLSKVIKGGVADVALEPFDVIFIPKSAIAKIDLFVEQYMTALIPRPLAFVFPYNLNTSYVTTRSQ